MPIPSGHWSDEILVNLAKAGESWWKVLSIWVTLLGIGLTLIQVDEYGFGLVPVALSPVALIWKALRAAIKPRNRSVRRFCVLSGWAVWAALCVFWTDGKRADKPWSNFIAQPPSYLSLGFVSLSGGANDASTIAGTATVYLYAPEAHYSGVRLALNDQQLCSLFAPDAIGGDQVIKFQLPRRGDQIVSRLRIPYRHRKNYNVTQTFRVVEASAGGVRVTEFQQAGDPTVQLAPEDDIPCQAK